jgi:hypothetical protein
MNILRKFMKAITVRIRKTKLLATNEEQSGGTPV